MTAPRSVLPVNLTSLFGPPPPDLLFPHLWNTTPFYDQSTGLVGHRDHKHDPIATLFPLPAHGNPLGHVVNTSPRCLNLSTTLSGCNSVDQDSGCENGSMRKFSWSPMSNSAKVTSCCVRRAPHDTIQHITLPSVESERCGRKRKCSTPPPPVSSSSSIPVKYTHSPGGTSRFARLASNNYEGKLGKVEGPVDNTNPHKFWRVGQRFPEELLLQPNPDRINKPKSMFTKEHVGGGSFKSSTSDAKSIERAQRQCEEQDEEEQDDDDDDDDEADNEGDEAELESKSGHSVECVVCGDKSSGKHYGQHTCEGCKSFFKRSVRRKLTYTCRGNRQCPIDIHHRNQCQYCRFQKCVKAGMRKEAVQQGRLPPFSTLYNPFFDHASFLGAMQAFSAPAGFAGPSFSAQFINMLLRAEPLSQRYSNATFAAFKRVSSSCMPPRPQSTTASGCPSKSTSPMCTPSTADKTADPNRGSTTTDSTSTRHTQNASQFNHPQTRMESEKKQTEKFDGFADMPIRTLLTAVEWARSLPVFAELQLNDQLALLKNAWPELFILNMIQTGFSVPPASGMDNMRPNAQPERHPTSPTFRTDSQNSADPHRIGQTTLVRQQKQSQSDSLTEYRHQLNSQLERLKQLQLDLPEFACLKSILLFNSEANGLSDPITVECIQEKAQSALEEYERCQYLHHQPFRFGRLLLRLPRLKQVNACFLQRLFFPHMDHADSVNNFIREILLHGPPPPSHPTPLTTSLRDRPGDGMLNLDFTEMPDPAFLSANQSMFPTLRFDCDTTEMYTNSPLCESLPSQATHLLSHLRKSSESGHIVVANPAATAAAAVTTNTTTATSSTTTASATSTATSTNIFNPFDPELLWHTRNLPLPHPLIMGLNPGKSNGCPVTTDFIKTNGIQFANTLKPVELAGERHGSTSSSAFTPTHPAHRSQTMEHLPNGHDQAFASDWGMFQNATNLMRGESVHTSKSDSNNSNGNNDVVLKLDNRTIASISSEAIRDQPASSPTRASVQSTLNQVQQSISNPATLQLYYAVMRHQLGLLQKQTWPSMQIARDQ